MMLRKFLPVDKRKKLKKIKNYLKIMTFLNGILFAYL